ncbi:MAG: hypothetical protein EOL95_07600 [Bacteroidia bacterium]|nr:hypothetical protein [Bacteroidia bacterium]
MTEKSKKMISKILDNDEVKDLKETSIKDVLSGNIFTKSYFLKQAKLILLIVALVFIYMNNRMVCEKQLTRIDKLNKELECEKYISMVTETELLSISRPEEIKRMVDEQSLQLEQPAMPPYKVIIKE